MAKQHLDSYAAYALEAGARMTPHPLQFKAQTRVDASRDELWAFVTDFTRIGDFIPMIKRSYSDDSNAEAPGQVGAVRVIYAHGAPKPTLETVKAFEAPRLLAYSAADENLFGMFTEHLSVITCEPHPDGGAVFTWLAYGKPAKNPALRLAGKGMFSGVLTAGTRNLAKRLSR